MCFFPTAALPRIGTSGKALSLQSSPQVADWVLDTVI